ncbi:uncharacterized protein LAJ45_02074 [Morchella importuna]|nr:uncharacterized protein LAJ45_02074 [Morchella importuna]KAH8154306.1 hypothetical protein LAJ45_02074 [Morchella importuna]
MSSQKNPSASSGNSYSAEAAPSPSNPRSVPSSQQRQASQLSQMSSYESGGPYSESAQSAGTVRRINNSGTEGSTEVPSSLDSFTSALSNNPSEHQLTAQNTDHLTTGGTGRLSRTSSAASSLRGRFSSSDKKPRRPSATRRASTLFQPHKGQEFSVDDETDEVEVDLEQKQRGHGGTGYTAMRRHSNILRRRGTQPLPNVDSTDDEGDSTETAGPIEEQSGEDEEEQQDDGEEEGTVRADDYEPSDAGSVESFTLKDRQEAINVTHPFGIRIWKPALYKKNRSVQRTAEGDIHSAPGGRVGGALFLVNILWVALFGWWLSLVICVAAATCYIFFFTLSAREYGRVLLGLAAYLFYPFGHFVELKQDDAYAEEDEGEGRSISEYEQWQAGDIEEGRTFFGPHTPSRTLIGRRRESLDSVDVDSTLGTGERTGLLSGAPADRGKKRRLFGRGEWNVGRVLFFVWFYFIIAPLLILVSGICWLLVFTIPMAKVTSLLFDHLRRHPLALSFHSDHTYTRRPGTPSTSILLCTYRAVGWKYYKYTIDGTNIFFINLMTLVIFVIADHYVLRGMFGIINPLTSPATVFTLSLFSVIPLAYFIGQAVASISAQSSMGMGATINAFFSTIVEVYLYCVALTEGKGRLVEGSVVGSILVGVVFMPGLSMCSGAIKRKTQRFNARSAGVTSTMLLFAVIGAFAPTLFYQIYGTYELSCRACSPHVDKAECRRCSFTQTPPTTNNDFYRDVVQPYTYLCAVFLFISYIIGLWFTLRTHAAVIWTAPTVQAQIPPSHAAVDAVRGSSRGNEGSSAADARSPNTLRDTGLYKRILGQTQNNVVLRGEAGGPGQTLHMVPPRSANDELLSSPAPGYGSISDSRQPIQTSVNIPGLSREENAQVFRGVAEMAAVAATAAVQDVQRHSVRKTSATPRPALVSMPTVEEGVPTAAHDAVGGHDAPNWSKAKSSIILLGATVLYAIIAEILVDTVDVVLENFEIDEKFLGITLFALVPNTTEFLNAISFAMNGNIALSMEIGSAYALQVCLLQIPALVAFSAFFAMSLDPKELFNHTFSLIFPQWDLVTVILCVFLLSYMYGEGKSNYFKGSILILSYLTVMMGFYFSSYAPHSELMVLAVGNKAFYGENPY